MFLTYRGDNQYHKMSQQCLAPIKAYTINKPKCYRLIFVYLWDVNRLRINDVCLFYYINKY